MIALISGRSGLWMTMLSTMLSTMAALSAGNMGCEPTTGSGARSLSYGESAEADYESAHQAMLNGRCLEAEPAFRRIRREYPYSRYAALSELRIADCKLEQREYASAISAYRRFIRARPSHDQVAYARFRIAESYYRQIPDGWFLSPPDHERDQGPTRNALQYLRRFILDFPEHDRIPEAQRMVERALRMLAEHEMYVARFYRRRGADRAVVMRLQALLNTYPGSGLEPEALLMLGRAFNRLDEDEQARSTFQELVDRFPESEQASDARSALN